MLCDSKHESTKLQATPFWRISVSPCSYWWVSLTPAHMFTHRNCSRDSMENRVGQKQTHFLYLKTRIKLYHLARELLQSRFCKGHLRNSETDPCPHFTLKVCESRDVQCKNSDTFRWSHEGQTQLFACQEYAQLQQKSAPHIGMRFHVMETKPWGFQ